MLLFAGGGAAVSSDTGLMTAVKTAELEEWPADIGGKPLAAEWGNIWAEAKAPNGRKAEVGAAFS